jgi:hypothetical protein
LCPGFESLIRHHLLPSFTSGLPVTKRVFVATALAVLATTALAQLAVRTIPAQAARGKFTALALPLVKIDGKTLRLAPGARIFSATNTTVTPNQVPADSPVAFLLDSDGQVETVWVLTAQERARK